ncbi:bromodomain testis-specific protein isoform X1 [Neltuma alba]|uniref:bromodomain testis-specific protein isoform X1 n=1 Tax=Neltuma alba TaxID=207710 RepID=UPI0010A37280|nr:bromodomain testis-specific protein-like isoform X1 [Prosopis alba]
MKRKRGNKKAKSKVAPVISANETSGNKEEASGLDEYGNNKSDSGMEADTPSSTGTDHHYNLASINPDGSVEKAAGKSVGRVKVKLRTSKMLDSQLTSSDAPTQSDTDKSSQHQGLEKQGVNTERTEDSANSLPEIKLSVLSKKAGSIKIKSSKVLGSSSSQTGKVLPPSGGHTHHKETNATKKNPRYNKQELDAALVVIRKVMRMDAAEPFNVPVNPEALGIPDYFDIIDTPMDFGTICSNLERNDKYMNSEDVFKDVQYIWSNCYKYNNKGDYILDLMRRVKKNFMKYWSAAGLYSEQSRGPRADDGGQSGEGKVAKGSQAKQKSKKRHGRRHKHDCLCAICVLKRRRREREESARIAKASIGSGDDRHAREKQEESMQVDSPGSEDSSSNMDESQSTDGDVEEEKGEELKTEAGDKQFSPSEGKQKDMDTDDGDDEDEDDDNDEEEGEVEEDGEEEDEETEGGIQKKHKGENLKPLHPGDETAVKGEQQEGQALAIQQQKLKESRNKQERAKLLEKFCYDNPQLSSLCAALFPKSSVSVWSGPNSLNHQRKTFGTRTNSISAAVQTLMK